MRHTSAAAVSIRIPGDYLPALDGLRAIAIVLVILYHAFDGMHTATESQKVLIRVAGQGWIGVDMFFVLSGFLITGILLDSKGSVHAMRNFYARRCLRIVPVYVVFLLFSLYVANRVGTSTQDEVAQLSRTQSWYWTYAVNLLIAFRNWGAITRPTGHLWSLSVEEQFYLIWPFLVLAFSAKTVRRIAVGCVIGAELARIVWLIHSGEAQAAFVLLPFRIDALAAGAFLACAYRERTAWAKVLRVRQAGILTALILLLGVIVARHTVDIMELDEQLLVLPALIVLGGAFVASAVQGVKWLSSRPFAFIARISYGMYVWHIVAIRLVAAHVSRPLDSATPNSWWKFYAITMFGAFSTAIALAFVSWHVLEKPLLGLKRFVPMSAPSLARQKV